MDKTRIEVPQELGRELAQEVGKMLAQAVRAAASCTSTDGDNSAKYPYFMGYMESSIKNLAKELGEGSVLIR